MVTTTQQKPVVVESDNGAGAARPAPLPDEELRRSIENEAMEVEREEELLGEDAVSVRLFNAAREVTDKIEALDLVIKQAEEEYNATVKGAAAKRDAVVEKTKAQRAEWSTQFQNALNKMQSQYGISEQKPHRGRGRPSKHATAKSQASGKGEKVTVRTLIVEFMEKNRHAKTSEIRSFLEGHGKNTNPGVELSRMVKDGTIVNKERGIYTMPRGK